MFNAWNPNLKPTDAYSSPFGALLDVPPSTNYSLNTDYPIANSSSSTNLSYDSNLKVSVHLRPLSADTTGSFYPYEYENVYDNAYYNDNPVSQTSFVPVTTSPIPVPTHAAGSNTSRILYIASDFVLTSNDEKQAIISALISSTSFNINDLRKLVTLHQNIRAQHPDGRKKTTPELRTEFREHQCTQSCLIQREHANSAGLINMPVLLETDFYAAAKALKLRNYASSSSSQKRRTERTDLESNSEWLEILSWDEKRDIMQEFYDAGNNASICCLECSFCGGLQSAHEIASIPCPELDISLLEAAVQELREKTNQPTIQCFRTETIENGCYRLCSYCKREIRYVIDNHHRSQHRKFQGIPLRSYANGIWIGNLPEKLQGLTILEEQCIARARSTKCMFKLELGPTVMGSPDCEITIETLKKTPLLVRRSKIINALKWLKSNNPLYHDLNIDSVETNAAVYPEHGIPIPLQSIIRTRSNSEGVSYTQEANAEQFNENVSPLGMPSSTVVDADHIDSTYKMRKLGTFET
ncbi:hypothetical protein K435DRAFT_853090 [Dendrothele bispora CBS 962.96]|uniref:DUF6570 domain-containing protein n=1 Tax=Dendrothele bispora (strain CBS 962.96) TaxID=1314807 RepID=A0A4S8MHF9_DENBC|nr:hypothetical protein K435DRAFT_853090 [Dendrothele bispora CBS 962.96]